MEPILASAPVMGLYESALLLRNNAVGCSQEIKLRLSRLVPAASGSAGSAGSALSPSSSMSNGWREVGRFRKQDSSSPRSHHSGGSRQDGGYNGSSSRPDGGNGNRPQRDESQFRSKWNHVRNDSPTQNYRAPLRQVASTESFTDSEVQTPVPSTPVSTGSIRMPSYRYVSKFKEAATAAAAAGENEDGLILSKIRGKLNRFSNQNYKSIHDFLSEILSGDEVNFLHQFMELIFEKATREETFCTLYAKLLAELTAQFPYLNTEIYQLFTDYLDIFDAAATEVDVGAEQYSKFVDAAIRKKYRRSYSQFLAELARHNIIHPERFMQTVIIIVENFEKCCRDDAQVHLVEEYADCLGKVVPIAGAALRHLPEMNNSMNQVRSILSAPGSQYPGLNFRSRFAVEKLV